MSSITADGAAGTTEPVALRLSGISKRFGALNANQDISLELRRGEIVSLLGENGAGKTTLMNILFGHYVADAGTVEVADTGGTLHTLPAGSPGAALRAGVGMVHQHFALADNLTVLDNVVLGTQPLFAPWLDKQAARRRIAELTEGTGLEVDTGAKVTSLSVGQRQRVEIIKALYRDARILILDEPTAVLTPQEADGLFETLRKLAAGGLAVIFISHKLDEVMAISDRVAVLRHGQKVLEVAAAETSKEDLAEAMVGRPVAAATRGAAAVGAAVLKLDGIGAPAMAGSPPLRDISLTVRSGEVVGIAGISGNGQSSLAALVSGLHAPADGSIDILGLSPQGGSPAALTRSGAGRIPEDRHHEGVVADFPIWANTVLETRWTGDVQRGGFLRLRRLRAETERLIETYDIRCSGPAGQTRLMSGGNMQKLILARVLDRGPRFVVASQPTRGLDIGAVSYVHGRLLEARSSGAGVLLFSEDLEELLSLSDRIAVIYSGRVSEAHPTEALDMRMLGLMMAGETVDVTGGVVSGGGGGRAA